MKNVTINLAASWAATFRSYQDGDVFRESNIDLAASDMADRLGYLKAQEALSAKLAADQVFTGSNTFSTGATKTTTFTGDNAVEFDAANFGAAVAFGDDISCASTAALTALTVSAEATLSGFLDIDDTTTLADANATIATALARVPVLTADRTYTLPSATDGRIVIFTRPNGGAAFYARLNDPSAVEIGRIPASNAGFIVAHCSGGTWRAALWSSTATNVSTV